MTLPDPVFSIPVQYKKNSNNQKWYINASGVKVKPCARCKKDFPCTPEFYKIKPNGNCYAYCHDCKKIKDRNYRSHLPKTDKKWTKLPVVIRDGTPYKQCTSCGVEYPFTREYYDAQKNGQRGLKSSCIFCKREYARETNKRKWAWHLFNNARGSSRRYGLEIDIDEKYILDLYDKQKGRCYWLGIEMQPSSEPKHLLQPSLDRVDRRFGYVKGNVVLCCFMANFGRNENSEEQWKQFLVTMKQNLDFSQWQ